MAGFKSAAYSRPVLKTDLTIKPSTISHRPIQWKMTNGRWSLVKSSLTLCFYSASDAILLSDLVVDVSSLASPSTELALIYEAHPMAENAIQQAGYTALRSRIESLLAAGKARARLAVELERVSSYWQVGGEVLYQKLAGL